MRGARTKARARFQFNVQKQPVTESASATFPQKPHLDPKPAGCQSCRKSVGGASTSTTDSRKKAGQWDIIPDVLHHPHLHLLYRLVPFLESLISGEALLPVGFCLIC